MLLQRLAVDEDVVQEHDHEVVQVRPEHLLHEVHERGRRVGQAERQHEELVVPVPRAERGLRHVGRIDAHLVVARAQIDLAEVLRTVQPIEQLIDAGQRVLVLDGDLVQRTVVDTHAQLAALLLDEQHGRTEWRLTRLDEAVLLEVGQLLAQLVQLGWAQPIRGSRGRHGAGVEFDSMVDIPLRRETSR